MQRYRRKPIEVEAEWFPRKHSHEPEACIDRDCRRHRHWWLPDILKAVSLDELERDYEPVPEPVVEPESGKGER